MAHKDLHNNNPTQTWHRPIIIGLVSALLVGVLSLAFLWPAKTAAPRNVPISITGGNKQQVAAITKMVEANAKGKIDLIEVSDRNHAIDKMKHRETFGTIVLSGAPEVLTASANGPAINGVITNIATNLESNLNKLTPQHIPTGGQSSQLMLKKTDVVPAHSASFDIAQLGLPIVLGGTVGSVMVLALTHGRIRRLAALGSYSVFAGIVLYFILHSWFNVLPGNFWAITGSFGLGIFAIGSFVAGMYTLLGLHGIGLAAAVNLLIANPISGLAIPTLFMPGAWGTIGQLFTVGATGTLLRGALYFPVSEVLMMPIVVLTVWAIFGVAAMLSASREPISR